MAADREEQEWQAMVAQAGIDGRYWALVLTLLSKRLITIDELKDAIAAQAGATVITRSYQ